MLKIKNLIPLSLFCLYFFKTLIKSNGYEDAGILLILGSIASFYEFKSEDTKISTIEKQIAKLEQDIELKNKDVDSIKNAMASMKLAQGMRGLGSVNGR